MSEKWWGHPFDRTADVAVLFVNPQPDADYLAIALKDFATPELIRERDIGIGDDVFFTGLFTEASGIKRNMPIVRHGNIAMMPDEQIQTDLGFADVYLVEARSIGGISGSPVFVRPTVNFEVKPEASFRQFLQGVGNHSLLGLMHGHWDVKESEMNKPHIVHNRKQGVNLGISVVVPAIKIIETINRPELVEMRAKFEQKIIRQSVPGTDSARPKETKFTREDFEAALKKASRKVATLKKK